MRLASGKQKVLSKVARSLLIQIVSAMKVVYNKKSTKLPIASIEELELHN